MPSNHRPSYLPAKTPYGTGQGDKDYELYNSKRWRRTSRAYRAHVPLCEVSEAIGEVVPADVVDHIVPISKGGSIWSPTNMMALCHEVHNRKRGHEAHGYVVETRRTEYGLVPADRDEIISKLTG